MAANARRLLELWSLYARMDILFLWRGTSLALAYYVSDLVIGTAAVTATFLLAERFDGIGVWSKHQVVFLLGYALLVRGCLDVFFNFNLLRSAAASGAGSSTTCSSSRSRCGWCC